MHSKIVEPQYTGSVLGNITAEHYSASNSSSNIQASIPKVGPPLSGIIKMSLTHMSGVKK